MLALVNAIDRFRMGLMLGSSLVSAQLIVAQMGTTKTALGWLIVVLCIGLGLIVVCRPSNRKSPLKR